MGRAGVIDIQGGWRGHETLAIHIFNRRAGKYEFEKTIDFSPSGFLGNQLEGVTEFSLSLPLSFLNFRLLKFPFSDRQKLKGVIPFELEGLVLGGPESVTFDSLVVSQSDGAFDVLVAYVERKTLQKVLASLSSGGIDPQVITSIELRGALNKADGDIASRLVNAGSLVLDERMDVAGKELLSPIINLRTGPFAYTRDIERMKKSLRVTAILSLLLALVINVDLALTIGAERREAFAVKKDIRSSYVGLFPNDRKITDESYQLKSKMKELREREDALAGIFPLRVMLDLAQRPVQGVKFDEMSLDKEIATMKGEAVSMEGVDRMRAKLSEFLNDVMASDIKTTVDGKIRFTIVAKVRQS